MSAGAAMMTADAAAPRSLRGRVGMACMILAESSFFAILVVAYLFYIGKSLSGPQPADVLDLPVVPTVALLSSSITITLAVRALRAGSIAGFAGAWFAPIFLGAAFLVATGLEWKGLIEEHGLTISTNLFGSTYYTLVGFHAAHVVIGVSLMLLVLALTALGHLTREHAERVEILSWYWHFVDVVWIVVFTVVYVVGR